MLRKFFKRSAVPAMIGLLSVGAPISAAAQLSEPNKCETPALSVLVIDDQVNISSWAAEQVRQFKLPMPAGQMRKDLEQSGCVTVLDSDPVFASVAGTAQPDAILRVRLVNMKVPEKSLGEKAGSAVGRYLGSYLGNSGDEVPVLKSVELASDLLCARTRRMIHQFAAQSSSADSAKADDNIATLNDATTQMVGEVIQFLQARPVACEPSR